MLNRTSLLVAFGVILGTVVVAAGSANAWSSRTNYLTFSAPVSLPGVTLGAGSYVFERITPEVVRVSHRTTRRVYLTAFTHAIARPASMPRGQFVTLGESPAGLAPPIKAWFPEGYAVGHEFIYPR